MNNQGDKNFVNGLYSKKKVFQNGGEIIKIWVKVDEMCAWLQANKDEKGNVNMDMSGSREPRFDDKGDEMLNCWLDRWKPDGSTQGNNQQPQQPAPQQRKEEFSQPQPISLGANEFNDDDIPF